MYSIYANFDIKCSLVDWGEVKNIPTAPQQRGKTAPHDEGLEYDTKPFQLSQLGL